MEHERQIGRSRPGRAPAARLEGHFGANRFVFIRWQETGCEPALADTAPGCFGTRRRDAQPDGEALQVSGIAAYIHMKFRRRRKTSLFERIGDLAKPVLQSA